MTTTDDRRFVSFPVTDIPVAASDANAVHAINQAVAAIERAFVGGADWRCVVGSLQLMRRILEEPPRTCRRCGAPFQLEHGVRSHFIVAADRSPSTAATVGPRNDWNARTSVRRSVITTRAGTGRASVFGLNCEGVHHSDCSSLRFDRLSISVVGSRRPHRRRSHPRPGADCESTHD
jgi:hypothetical protein